MKQIIKQWTRYEEIYIKDDIGRIYRLTEVIRVPTGALEME